MKNFLFFTLGFTIVFAFFISYGHAADRCTVHLYKKLRMSSGFYNTPTWQCTTDQVCIGNDQGNYGFTDGIEVEGKSVLIFDCGDGNTCYSSGIGSIYRDIYGTLGPLNSWKLIPNSINWTDYSSMKEAGYLKCDNECADSDNDGLCDVCDDAPNDSTVGPTKYVRGYYELNDGTTVATIYSYSATDKTNDLVTIDKKYNYPDKFPGLVYAVGMASYIDEKEFFKGGGRFAGLSKAEPVYTMKCNAVESLDQCSKAVCNIIDAEPKILEKLEDVEENGEAQAYPTEQKAADAPYLDLDKTCDELRTKCNSSCGAATNVKSFGCSENKHMVCECLNNGTWEVADNWDELGVTIDQSETTTNNYYGEGDSTTGGGSVTGVSDDGTGGFTGSYEYVEGSYNYDSFGSHYSQLASKFPFSLRTTIGSIYSGFQGSGAAPVYNYTIHGHSVTIDLSSFDDIAKMVRSIFALGITLSTMIMLIYLYVGIDLRGK